MAGLLIFVLGLVLILAGHFTLGLALCAIPVILTVAFEASRRYY